MLSTAVGPDRHHLAGQTYDLDAETARDYLAGGYAVEVAPARSVVSETTEAPMATETADARPRRGLKPR